MRKESVVVLKPNWRERVVLRPFVVPFLHNSKTFVREFFKSIFPCNILHEILINDDFSLIWLSLMVPINITILTQIILLDISSPQATSVGNYNSDYKLMMQSNHPVTDYKVRIRFCVFLFLLPSSVTGEHTYI